MVFSVNMSFLKEIPKPRSLLTKEKEFLTFALWKERKETYSLMSTLG